MTQLNDFKNDLLLRQLTPKLYDLFLEIKHSNDFIFLAQLMITIIT